MSKMWVSSKRNRQNKMAGRWSGLCRCLETLEKRLLLAGNIYVDLNALGPTRNGLSWTTAYTDLQATLTAATSGTRILVADGTYKPHATDPTKSFVLKNGVTLEGGYAGASNPATARNISLYQTILSGDIGTTGYINDNSYHVVIGSDTDNSSAIRPGSANRRW